MSDTYEVRDELLYAGESIVGWQVFDGEVGLDGRFSADELREIADAIEGGSGWVPTRWRRAIGPAGELWVESSDESEVRSAARPDDRIERQYQHLRFKWVAL